VYCRLHRSAELPAFAWSRGEEAPDAERITPDPAPNLPSREVFVYFDNDAKVRAPVDAKGIIARAEKWPRRRRVR
jgi:hypothetical protein